jgi:hypothetical protein
MGQISLRSTAGIISIFFFINSQSLAQAIDTTLVRIAHFTGHGNKDTVRFHFVGCSMESPFKWSLTIRSSGRTIFYQTENDSSIDKFFAAKGYVGNCNDYLSCKRRWYFDAFLPLFLVAPKNFIGLKESEVIENAKQFLVDSCQVPTKEIIKIAHEIVSLIKTGRCALINFPVGPGFGPVWIYVNRLKRFVPIWYD